MTRSIEAEAGSPEYESRVPPRLAGVDLIGAVVLCEGDLHELGDVEGEREDGDGHDVDQQPLGVGHGLVMGGEYSDVTVLDRF